MLIGFISFAANWMLWGAGLASLPIIIHLLNRRRYRVMDWAAMTWLLEAMKKNQRRMRFEHWLLLAVRTLLILLVALAMARPTFDTGFSIPLVAASQNASIIILDHSMSMYQVTGSQSRLDKAKAAAHAILDDAQTGDLASLIVMGPNAQVVVAEPTPNLDAVGKEIDSIKPLHGVSNWASAVEQALALMKSYPTGRKRVYFITDLQRTSAIPGTREVKDDLAAGLKKIAAQAQAVIIDVGTGSAANQAVVGLNCRTPVAVKGVPIVYDATIANFAPQPIKDLKVNLLLDGEVESNETVSIEAGKTTTINFTITPRDVGNHVVEVRLPKDTLALDDSWKHHLQIRSAINVLLIDGQQSTTPFRSETSYLDVALSPDPSDASASLIRTTVRSDADLGEVGLQPFDLVMLCNVPRITTSEIGVLEEYARRGGGVVFALGTSVGKDLYNTDLYKSGAGLLPAKLLEQSVERDPSKRLTFDPVGYKHPVMSIFRSAEQAGILNVRTTGHWKSELDANNRDLETALKFSNGDAALVLKPFGRGKSAALFTSIDLDWNNWALSPSFVPVMQELVAYMIRGRARDGAVMVSKPYGLPVGPEGTKVVGKLLTPEANATAVPLKSANVSGMTEVTVAETDQIGAYRLMIEEPTADDWSFAVNSNPAESDLTALSDAEFSDAYHGFEHEYMNSYQSMRTVFSNKATANNDWARPLLYGALGLALFELLLLAYASWSRDRSLLGSRFSKE